MFQSSTQPCGPLPATPLARIPYIQKQWCYRIWQWGSSTLYLGALYQANSCKTYGHIAKTTQSPFDNWLNDHGCHQLQCWTVSKNLIATKFPRFPATRYATTIFEGSAQQATVRNTGGGDVYVSGNVHNTTLHFGPDTDLAYSSQYAANNGSIYVDAGLGTIWQMANGSRCQQQATLKAASCNGCFICRFHWILNCGKGQLGNWKV